MGRKRARSRAMCRAAKRRAGGEGEAAAEAAAPQPAAAAPKAAAGRSARGPQTEAFAEYYRAQKIVPEADWATFEAALRRPLPVTFRMNSTAAAAAAVEAALQEARAFLRPTVPKNGGAYAYTDFGRPVDAPFELPWCRGWQLGLDSGALKFSNDPVLRETRDWLVRNGAIGLLIRQAVDSMLPVALLDVQPDDVVLDMCASPGSKTTQCVEALFAKGGVEPTGFVVANDVSPARAYTLVRRCDALGAAAARLAIVSHPGQSLPALTHGCDGGGGRRKRLVTKICCDVPCCGDGTLRKNPEIWQRWAPTFGKSLHSLQLQIALRGLSLLAVGGTMSYSTCTFNPVENEAVVAELLRRTRGAVELVDVSDKLPELPRDPGITTWKVCGDDMRWLDTYEDSQAIKNKKERRRFRKSMWPPNAGGYADGDGDAARVLDQLHRCCRIVPHYADTGGFFVAILRKVAPFPEEDVADGAGAQGGSDAQPAMTGRPVATRAEKEFRARQLSGDALESVRASLGARSKPFAADVAPSLLVRADELPSPVWYAAPELAPLIRSRLHVVRGGVKVLVPGYTSAKSRKLSALGAPLPPMELTAEGATLLAPQCSRRSADASSGDARLLLAKPNATVALKSLSSVLRKELKKLEPGAVVVTVPTTKGRAPMSGVLSTDGLCIRFHASRGREHGPKAACAAVLKTLAE